MKTRFQMILLLVLTSLVTNVRAQEVSIPDLDLNGAIRETLRKPAGSLTEADLLTLTNLYANYRGVISLEWLGAAHNLTELHLTYNHFAALTLPAGLTSLTFLNLNHNPLTSLTLLLGQRTIPGAFEFTLTGPHGAYTILGSADLTAWSELGKVTNVPGTAVFTDSTAKNTLQNFYRARTAP